MARVHERKRKPAAEKAAKVAAVEEARRVTAVEYYPNQPKDPLIAVLSITL